MEGEKQFETPTRQKEKLPDNVVVVERPEARYRIVYEIHKIPHTPEEIGHPAVLAVEFVSFRYDTPAGAEDILERFWEHKAEGAGKSMQERVGTERKYLEERHIPIAFVDVPYEDVEAALSNEKFISFVEVATAVTSAQYVKEKLSGLREEGFSRREFLKLSAAGMLGAYTGLELLNTLLDLYWATKSGHGKMSPPERKLIKLQETVHPELKAIILTLRNAIFARKLYALANHFNLVKGEKPEIAITVGAAHTGLEDMLLEDPLRRGEVLEKFFSTFGIDKGKISISPIAVAMFSTEEGRWVVKEIFNDPLLNQIERKWRANIQ
ncbi:MAG: hypothetical protein HYW91_02605 [Candidatus Sungbacteria bacterium]|nr:hypothetical protein [Candidatus Sungbacteria bacterium]